jgi:hypothetical protein
MLQFPMIFHVVSRVGVRDKPANRADRLVPVLPQDEVWKSGVQRGANERAAALVPRLWKK